MICQWCKRDFPKRKGRFCGTCYPPHNPVLKLKHDRQDLIEAVEILLVQIGEYKDGDGAAKLHAINIAKAFLLKARGSA